MTAPISVLLPTFGRDRVLVDTLEQLLGEDPGPAEILVLDQTLVHDPRTTTRLRDLHAEGRIRWIRLDRPSQPGALNQGLALAREPVVLMLDDDIEVVPGLVRAHVDAYSDSSVWAVAGSVVQPGQSVVRGPANRTADVFADLAFPFHSDESAWVTNGMSGNLSVRLARARAIGGFDENFIPPVAYRFDADFCRRLVDAGGRILFEPRARIRHLRVPRGGTRSGGTHLTSASPVHGVGDYYFALRHGRGISRAYYILRRPLREIATRFHLRRPWWIPVKIVGEARALCAALRLWASKPGVRQFSETAPPTARAGR